MKCQWNAYKWGCLTKFKFMMISSASQSFLLLNISDMRLLQGSLHAAPKSQISTLKYSSVLKGVLQAIHTKTTLIKTSLPITGYIDQ